MYNPAQDQGTLRWQVGRIMLEVTQAAADGRRIDALVFALDALTGDYLAKHQDLVAASLEAAKDEKDRLISPSKARWEQYRAYIRALKREGIIVDRAMPMEDATDDLALED